MKSHFQKFMVAILVAAGMATSFAAPPAAPAAAKPKEIPKSVFVMPSGPKEGRDPFFPNSQRPYISNSKNVSTPSLTELTVKSILPSGNRAFAIINNHTFAPGDDGVVTLKDGRRLTIHCIDINVEASTVTVEAGGARAVLSFKGK